MKISVIIPALEEEGRIVETIKSIRQRSHEGHIAEIIVVDGGSKDGTVKECLRLGVKLVSSPKARRSIQMNVGAEVATGEILYFLHADCHPPANFGQDILTAIDSGHCFGCFRRQVKGTNPSLKLISWFSRINLDAFRGGDASLFVVKSAFLDVKGFREDMVLMEDFEILKRLRRQGRFKLLPSFVVASDRKYHDNSKTWRITLGHLLVFGKYHSGYSQESLIRTYRRWVKGVRGVSREQS